MFCLDFFLLSPVTYSPARRDLHACLIWPATVARHF